MKIDVSARIRARSQSEEFVGRAIKTYARREEIVVATKVSGKLHDGPGGSGLSRVAIMEQGDASLRRLDTVRGSGTTTHFGVGKRDGVQLQSE